MQPTKYELDMSSRTASTRRMVNCVPSPSKKRLNQSDPRPKNDNEPAIAGRKLAHNKRMETCSSLRHRVPLDAAVPPSPRPCRRRTAPAPPVDTVSVRVVGWDCGSRIAVVGFLGCVVGPDRGVVFGGAELRPTLRGHQN